MLLSYFLTLIASIHISENSDQDIVSLAKNVSHTSYQDMHAQVFF